MKTSKVRELYERLVHQQRKWIEKCGGDLAGYIANYGDPGIARANGRTDMAGNGGTAIYAADMAELKRLEERLASLTQNDRPVKSGL